MEHGMTVILVSDAYPRLAAVPRPIEWDVGFTRADPSTWDVAVNLVAERDPYTMTPDPLIAAGTVRAEAVGDAHRFHIRESETLTWFGGDRTMAALARKIIDEVTR